uniref:RNase H type-1 domain-containing protein n=1 Tax=Oryza glaberrima TaxID=4538 RepID=I1PU42_ORYGL
MKRYLEVVQSMEKCFTGITVEHLPRGLNEEADALAKSAAYGGPHSPGIFFEVLYAPSVPVESLEVMAIDQAKLGEDPCDWRTPFIKYLETGWLPEDEAEAKRLQLTPTRPTKFSLFMLLYGDEAMTPTELGANSPRVTFSWGEEGREVSLELLEGVRVEALEHMRKYATGTSATYNKKVRLTELLPGHLVLRKKEDPIAVGKLESKWEGPYLIKHKSRMGSFRLATLEGEEFDHSWNPASLKRFYV